jgi:hypothetical protein
VLLAVSAEMIGTRCAGKVDGAMPNGVWA